MTAAASATRGKAETERSVEEMIQQKKAAAPTKAGKCGLMCFDIKYTSYDSVLDM